VPGPVDARDTTLTLSRVVPAPCRTDFGSVLGMRPILCLAVLTPALAAGALFALSGKQASEQDGAAPVRVRLFDRMAEATSTHPPVAAGEATVQRWAYDFDGAAPQQVWFARLDGRDLDWTSTAWALDELGGRPSKQGDTSAGGALRMGPGLGEDLSRASLLLPARGRARWVVSARVKVEGNPESSEGSSREAVRIVEHQAEITDPTPARLRRQQPVRVSRRIDPSGWDIVETELVTSATTRTLELQLLHRTGGAAEAITRFDDITIEETPLDEAQLVAHLTRRYRPNDGQEQETPWRLRVELLGEVRDAVLVPTAGELSLPLEVPAAATAPRLRFQLGALPEATREKGDGSRMTVAFVDGAGETTLGVHELDPKNDRSVRGWQRVELDLTPVAGRTGRLAFRVADVDDQPDELDALLVATPRIEPASADAKAPAFNVLLIGVDTLRADRMSAYGYERATTPALAALAAEGVTFAETRSQAPWTLPSFSSTLTSLYPSAHGAGRGGHDEWEPIDPTTLALAEVLARNGYETAGIVANGLISPRYGLDQGFDSYRSAWSMESVQTDTPRVIDFVERHGATPWLLFWHIMDPHLPYDAPKEFREQFTDPAYGGRFGGSRPNVPFQVLDPRPGRRWFAHEGPPKPPELTPEDVEYIAGYYDAEIAEMDAAVGRVLEALRKSGQYERTIVAFVADHGEGLGDHGHYHHGYTLFDDQVHIPMLLRIPGAHVGRVIERPVAAIDLAPTLLGALGIPIPDTFQGVDRLAQNAPTDDHFFIEYPTYDSSAQKAWIEGRFKYLHDPLFHTEELYDTIADPGELTNIVAAHPDVAARARVALDAFRVEHIDRGRFHLRVRGKAGQRLTVKVKTDDLFDANFVAQPAIDERHFEMDLDRTTLSLDTTLTDGRQELVFWCRGDRLDFEVALDGAPLAGLDIREGRAPVKLPATLARRDIEQRKGEDSVWPRERRGMLWLEAGAGNVLPVVNTPEELERLRALGYSR
jgi:arylsulfatase A-like enzyme